MPTSRTRIIGIAIEAYADDFSVSRTHPFMTLGTHVAFASVLYLGGVARFGYRPDGISGALAAGASLLPDVDLPPARIGRLFWFVSVPLERRFGPRTLTHSAVMLLAVVVLAAPLGLVQSLYDGAVVGGYGSSRRGKNCGHCSGRCSMAKDGKRSRRPPQIGGHGSDALEAFIGGAGVHTAEPSEPAPAAPEPALASSYPWEAPGVREDVAQVFNLRPPEPYLLKLKLIAERSRDSMQQFCLNVLLPANAARIAALTAATQREPYRRG